MSREEKDEINALSRARYQANKEMRRLRQKEYDEAHPGETKARARRNYLKNRDKILARYHAKKVLDNESSSCENH